MIIVIVIFVVFIIGGSYLAYYLYNENNKINQDLNAKQARIELIRKKLEQFDDLDAELERLQTEEQQLVNYVPDREGQAQFVKNIESIADSCKVKINRCNNEGLSPLERLPEYVANKWSITLTGDYFRIIEFINQLPTTSQIIMISSISFNEISDKINQDIEVKILLDLIAKSTEKNVKSSEKKVKS